MATDKGAFDQILGRLMGLAGRAMRNHLDRNLAETGLDLSAEQGILLQHIDVNEGLNQKSLTGWMFCHKAFMTRLIDSLEEKGLVARVPDTSDRRQKMIYLTARGKELVSAIAKVGQLTDKQAVAGIEARKVAICKEVLVRVRENLANPDDSLENSCK